VSAAKLCFDARSLLLEYIAGEVDNLGDEIFQIQNAYNKWRFNTDIMFFFVSYIQRRLSKQ